MEGFADQPEPAASGYACPACGHLFLPASQPAGGLLKCPACGEQFFTVYDSSDEPEVISHESKDDDLDREAKLNTLRVQQLASLRRSMNRTRTYFLVGMVGCIGTAAQLLFKAWQFIAVHGTHERMAFYFKPIGYAFAAIAAGLGCIELWRQARKVDVELAKPLLPEPATAPDFSPLDNGSRYWKNIEALSKTGARR